MKTPVHNIKLYSNNNIPCPDSTWYKSAPHWYQNSASGWLGSGVKDINGVEIYEGDIILLDGKKFVATIDEGSFIIKDETGEFYYLEPLLGEIIGHIAEGKQ